MDIKELIKQRGGASHWARVLGLKSPQVVQHWQKQNKIPVKHVLALEAHFGIPRSVLRPDVYPPQ